MRRAGLILAVLVLAMLAFAGTADAKKHKKHKVFPVVSATATATGTSPYQVITATATCPTGKNAVGGGFSTPPLAPSPVDAGLGFASHKVGANQWTASAQVIGTPGPPVVLTTVVYCRKGTPLTTPVSTATPLPTYSGGPPTVSQASCPAGQAQLSGGFAQDPIFTSGGSTQAVTFESHRVDPLTWRTSGIALPSAHTLTTQADCAAQPKKSKKKHKKQKKLKTPTEATGDVTLPSSGSPQTFTAVATCPKRTFAVNGGFSEPGALTTTLNFLVFITESEAVGNTWHVSGFLSGGSTPGTLRSHGYCSA